MTAAKRKARAPGEGSVYPRKDGRWVAQVRYWEGGKRLSRTFYADTQDAARKELTRHQKALDDGQPLPSEQLTVKAFLTQWLEIKEDSLRPESYRRYADYCRLYLVPELGNIVLSKLTAANIQTCYKRCRTRLSGTSLSNLHGMLRVALKDATRWDMTIRNVADLVDRPKRTTPEMATLTAEETQNLLLAAQGDPLEAFYTIALTTGLRLGELQALRWRYVDFDKRLLQVTATLQGVKDGVPILSEPKTAKSKRQVRLSEMGIQALQRHRTGQLEQRLLAGGNYQDHDLVFANGFGRPLDGNNIRERSFKQLLTSAGLKPMRFHNLRHGAATLLMAEGVNIKVISEMLGHADITVTLKIYGHLLPSMQQEAANAMDRLFGAN